MIIYPKFTREKYMSKLTSADLKQITEIRKQISAAEKSNNQNDSKTLSEQKKELQILKKKAMQVLSGTEKRINEIQRDLKPLVKVISQLTADANNGNHDSKKAASVKIKDSQKKLQELQKELELRKKQQRAIIQALNDKPASKPKNTFSISNKKTPPTKKEKKGTDTKISQKFVFNPLQIFKSKPYIPVAIIIVILLTGMIAIYFYNKGTPSIEAPIESTEPGKAQIDDSIIEINAKGTITGNNVNLRVQPDVSSDVIRQLHNNSKVNVIAKTNSANRNGAVLVGQTQITMESGKKIKLDAGKGITITDESESSYTVSYPISDGKIISGTVDKNSVKKIAGETWYQVKTSNTTGWIFGKFIIVE